MASLREILAAGGVTLFLLIGLSVYSLAMMWERWSVYRRSLRGLDTFLDRLRQSLAKGQFHELMDYCEQHRAPFTAVALASLSGPVHKEERKRSAERALERELTRLHRGLNALGTIGSIAPFIGLFGTVIGVMRAFRDLAAAAGAGPGVVAVGISEALVATAAGLFVAIPAVIGYNYFTARSARFSDEMRWAVDEILEHLTEKAAK